MAPLSSMLRHCKRAFDAPPPLELQWASVNQNSSSYPPVTVVSSKLTINRHGITLSSKEAHNVATPTYTWSPPFNRGKHYFSLVVKFLFQLTMVHVKSLTMVNYPPHYSSSLYRKPRPRESFIIVYVRMMIGDHNHPNPTVHVPPWSLIDDPTVDTSFLFSGDGNPNCNADDYSPLLGDTLTALQRYLPSNNADGESDSDFDLQLDAYSCDNFRMFEFKVRKCARGRSHDWTECPYAHPGEKARRRDPRKYHYSGTACPDFRKGNCRKGDGCEYAHGVFECWLHPARYRTQPCKDGTNCRRRVCFFAHTPEQLRVLSSRSPSSASVAESYDGSPQRLALEAKALPFLSSPESVSPPSESPPMSPMTGSLSRSPSQINDILASLRQLQLNKVKSMPSSWGVQVGSPGFRSPRLAVSPMTRPVFCSLPSTPTRTVARPGFGYLEHWDSNNNNHGIEEEPVMERVESGRGLRAKMFERLSKENPLVQSDPEQSSSGPDVGWVSELVK